MLQPNSQRVHQGFAYLLAILAPYVAQTLKLAYGDGWWQNAVLGRLRPEQSRNLPSSGGEGELAASMDIALVLLLLDIYWHELFQERLGKEKRSWIRELANVRNELAHIGINDVPREDAWRWLDTMLRLSQPLDADGTRQIRSLRDRDSVLLPQMPEPQPDPKNPPIRKSSNLSAWREVILPHPDVAQGNYKNAEFAADLAQVARGEASPEYQDATEFFNRTYVTDGMKGLLTEAVQRITRAGGEPVIQLKTAFGGGKTHSMLALYHLLKSHAALADHPAIKPLLAGIGCESLPQTHVAVIVGTALDPSRGKRPDNFPGITVNTLWGEIAYQLALSSGKPELYELVREADKKAVSPGSETLKELFDKAGSCLVLMDELVAYAKKLYDQKNLPAGQFDNLVTFIQEISEAARASKSSLVVASIPESENEIGSQGGREALSQIEHTFGRMESIWKPVAAHEGFEVVRRRLFLDCHNPEGRDAICAAYGKMYKDNPADFPVEARDAHYRERMAACFPIHPELFDRLYEDWATLPEFQRTRGVLRLMAAVVHELWMNNDQSPMIQPGSLPLAVPPVRDELIRRLKDNWNAIVDKEVDGENSIPFLQDKGNRRYGAYQAARRVARTIMLGSAPTVKEQYVRGLESSRIRLGIVQPGDPVSLFNDALGSLRTALAYLYSNQSGDRFWYDTRPTLLKTVEDRATQIKPWEVEWEIEKRLQKLCKIEPLLAGVHVCPKSGLEVPDEDSVRMVVLGPGTPWNGCSSISPAIVKAAEILENRGNVPRKCRNMLVFLAADNHTLHGLEDEVRRFLAWTSVKKDSEVLNLDAAQNRETDNSLSQSSETVDLRIYETWKRMLIPVQKKIGGGEMEWLMDLLDSKDRDLIGRAVKVLARKDAILPRWSPYPLLVELDALLWKNSDDIEVQRLWDFLCTYCYLPRLRDYSVLEKAIEQGVASDEYFAYAAGFDGSRYVDLKFNMPARIEKTGLLVRKDVALRQIGEEAIKKGSREREAGTPKGMSGSGERMGDQPKELRSDPEPPQIKRRFFMAASLGRDTLIKDVGKIATEIINNIDADGEFEIRLEVQASAKDGFSSPAMRAVMENCRTLNIQDFGFEEN